MNLRIKLIGAAALIAMLVILLQFAQAQTGESKSNEAGRYQLFQGSYVVLDGKNNRADKESAVFLLDTTTGTVKKYATGLLKDGTVYESWESIPKK